MTTPLLLSYRAAARLLGVGRNATLHALIAAGHLVPVVLLGRARIPREQIEALARAGSSPRLPPVARPPKRKRTIADVVIT